jgi:leucyl aminopeptidase
MVDMKIDKAGAMTVFGIMKALSTIGSKNKVTAYLGLAENAIGPNAYRPGDIITMKNGLTVENLNSDAEGRIVLMDNITLAEEENKKFDMLYTFATLTGAAVNAFGDHTTALTGFNTKAKKQVISAGKKVDELFIDAPFNKYMLDAMNGSISDLSNLSNLGNMGCQTAGLFLTKAFKKEKNAKKYVHCDIAGTAYTKKSWGTNQKGATGATVRTFIELLK